MESVKKKDPIYCKTGSPASDTAIELEKGWLRSLLRKDFNDIENASKSSPFDVAFIGYAFAPKVERTIADCRTDHHE
jgi:hypothetical protein